MKKHFWLLCILTLIFAALPGAAWAAVGDTFDDGTLRYKITSETEVEVSGLLIKLDAEGKLNIPVEVENDGVTYTVTAIGNQAFDSNNSIKTVTFPETLTSIGTYAFRVCTQLEGELTLPDNVTSIGYGAFAGFFNPQTNQYLSNKLTSVKLPAKLQVLGSDAFAVCINLQSVTFPENLTEIGEKAFWRCNALQTITLPPNLNKIGSQAFQYTGLTSLEVPASVTEISDTAFSYCYSLANLKLNEGLKVIAQHAFSSCTSLTEVTIPASVEQIGNWAFQYSTAQFTAPNLEIYAMLMGNGMHTGTVVLADGADANMIFEAGKYKYMVTDSEKKEVSLIGLADSETEKPSGVLDDIPNTVTQIDKEYTVTAIGDGVFADCSGLTDIKLPDSITKIGKQAFLNCTGLSEITLPNNVVTIDDYAFSGCTGLSEVVWPGELKNICDHSFENCLLTNVVLPDKLENIGFRAFQFSKIENLLLPEGLLTIGEKAFYECKQLKVVNLPGSLTNLGEAAFYSCSSLQHINFADDFKLTELPFGLFANCISLQELVLPNSIQKIDRDAFSSCTGLQTLQLPNELMELEQGAFFECTALSGKLILPESLNSVGLSAFRNCRCLDSITIQGQNLLNNVDERAFDNVKLLICSDRDVYTYLQGIVGEDTQVWLMYDIADILLDPSFVADQPYTGQAIEPEVTLYVEEDGQKIIFEQDLDYTVTYENNVNVTAEGEYAKIIFTPTGNGRLYGSYREMTFSIHEPQVTVSFDSNGGSGEMPDVPVFEGESYTLPECGFTAPEGMRFKAWQIDGVEYAPGATYTVNANVVITAVWQQIPEEPKQQVTVSFSANGGSGEMPAQEVSEGESFTLPDCEFTAPEGMKFKAWQIGGVEYAPGATYTVTENIEITAVWEKIPDEPKQQVTVSFAANGGGGEMPAQEVSEGESFTLPECGFTAPEGMKFKAWQIGGVEYAPGVAYTVTEDIEITAVWEKIPDEPKPEELYWTITFEPNGGQLTPADNPVKVVQGRPLTLPNAAKEGYKLLHWQIGAGVNTAAANEVYLFTADTTVYAVWQEDEQPVKPDKPSSGGSHSRPSRPSTSEPAEPSKPTEPTKPTEPAKPSQPDGQNGQSGQGGQGFPDVKPDAWYAGAVRFVQERGLMQGNPDGSFAPNELLSRAMLAQIIYNYQGRPQGAAADIFADVKAGVWYAEAVNWAAAEGFVLGYGDGRFLPNDNITREQLAVILWRFAGGADFAEADGRSLADFSDAAQVSDYAKAAMEWAVSAGIMRGDEDARLNPQAPATRAEVAQVLQNFLTQDLAK